MIILIISYIVISVIALVFMRGSRIYNEEDIKDNIK